MGNTPAARLARLKVIYQSWAFKQTQSGYVAWQQTGDGVLKITADTVGELEAQLSGMKES